MFRKIPDREAIRDAAVQLLAVDRLSDAEIARQCAITRRTLSRWKQQTKFRRSIDKHRKRAQEESEIQILLEREQRIARLDSYWRSLRAFIKKRANSPEMQTVPGGKSGLLRRRRKIFRSQSQRGQVADYELDKPLLQAMRRLEVQASKLLGQWRMPSAAKEAEFWSRLHPDDHLSAKQERAAILLADARKSDTEVAAASGVNRRTLLRWKQRSSFRARIAELCDVYQRYSESIADKDERVRMISWRLQRLDQIRRERAKNPEMKSAPGGGTGILLRRRRLYRRGARAHFCG